MVGLPATFSATSTSAGASSASSPTQTPDSNSASSGSSALSDMNPDSPLTPEETEKPKKKRKGRVIRVLREQLSKDIVVNANEACTRSIGIAPSSTGSRLATTELKGALVFQLVSAASGKILAFSKPHLLDLPTVVSQVRVRATRRDNENGFQDVLLACLAALSARNSNHTAITLGSTSSLEVGTRRETAYHALAQHAVELAQDRELLREVSPRALEAVNLLRAALFVVSPKHEFAAELVAYGVRNFPDINSFASLSNDTALRGHSIISLVIHDAMVAIKLESPLQLSDFELTKLGWDRPGIFPELGGADYQRQIARVRTGANVLRALARHQLRGVLTNPEETHRVFRDLWSLADQHLAAFSDGPAMFEIKTRLYGIHIFVESNIAKLATRQYGPTASGNPILMTAQRRYLSCLKVFMYAFRPRSSSAYLYNLLGALEAVPGWLGLTLSGATQFEQGEGYLSSVGFCFDDVRRLLGLLESLGSISSRSDTFRVNLTQGMTALGISTSNSTRTPLDASIRLPSEFTLPNEPSDGESHCVAEDLVQKALDDICA